MFSFITHIAWQILQTLIACSLLLPVALHFIFYLQKKGQKQTSVSEELFEEKDFALIVSVDYSGEKVNRLIKSLLQLNYTNYMVYVVSNQNSATHFYTSDERLVWLPTFNTIAGSSGLQKFAVDNFKRPHTHVVFLDENCTADANFLNGLNVFFHQGFQVVQSRMIAKISNNFLSQLHTLRHIYNQFFQRYLLFELGSSATANNNGVAFTVSFYKKYLQSQNAMAASFTHVLPSMLMKYSFQIAFAKSALLFMESEKDFGQNKAITLQNKNGWHQQFLSKAQLLCKGIVRFDKNLFLSGLQLLQLPLFPSLFLSVFCLFINAFINPLLTLFWMVGMCLFSISFLSAAQWQASERRAPHSNDSAVLYAIQDFYEKNEVDMYSAAQSF